MQGGEVRQAGVHPGGPTTQAEQREALAGARPCPSTSAMMTTMTMVALVAVGALVALGEEQHEGAWAEAPQLAGDLVRSW